MKLCDHKSVGVIVVDPQERYLLLTRAKPPAGRAPIAGHVDEHGDPRAAAYAEAQEEAGLDLGIKLLTEGYLPNICRRPASNPDRPGHYWWIYATEVGRDVSTTFSLDETRGGDWYTADQLQELADRTALWCRGGISDRDYLADPGLEPAWVHWLTWLCIIDMAPDRLEQIEAVFSEANPR